MKEVNIYIYTEHTGSLKSGSGKYHVVLETTVKTKKGTAPATYKLFDFCQEITPNKLELTAFSMAVAHIKEPCRISVYTASEYIVNAFANGWPEKWEANNYKTRGKAIKHADMWMDIMEKIKEHDITILYAKKTPYTECQRIELKQAFGREKKNE